ncbi:MAG: TraI domain-containing protein [Tatlockia sp.]|nr:TraI domain-containing protein [Tatlockia sp.]
MEIAPNILVLEVELFHHHEKIGRTLQTKPLKDLTRIIQPPLLLAEEKREALMLQIRKTIALDEVRFDSLGLSLLHNFINHCQSLPETSTSYYSQQGGLLDHSLNRTEAALNLFQQYLMLEDQAELTEEQNLWQYALFSASILQGIGKLQIDYMVEIYDNNGQFLKQWNPVLESLVALGSHYSYEFQKESDEDLRRRLNLLIARSIMPTSGFAWIASNAQVLAVWLALLNEDTYAAGTLGAILIRANAISIQRYLNQLMPRGHGSRGGRYGRVSTFTNVLPDSVAEIEQQIGVELIQWLTKSLDGGRLMINKAPLLMVPGGLLMTDEVLRLFMLEHPEYKNLQAVKNGFLSLGMHKLGTEGNVNFRFEQSSNQQMHSGMVFTNYAVALPPEVQVHNLNTGKSVKTSAEEVINQGKLSAQSFTAQQAAHFANTLAQLDRSGQWKAASAPASPQASMKLGATNGA